MAEPIIHVIPEQYYGGAFPKTQTQNKPRESFLGGISPRVEAKERRSISPKVLFIIIVGALFVFTIIIATWYFITQAKPVQTPVVVQQKVAPEPIVSETPEVIPEPAQPLPPASVPKVNFSADVDNDGLSLSEESMYGSKENEPDTDKDGFLDGHEVFNLYNPSGLAPEKLEAAGFVRFYSNQIFKYKLLVPSKWKINEEANGITISNENDARVFEARVAENINGLALKDWYKANKDGDAAEWNTNKAGVRGLLSPDRRVGYFGSDKLIYSISFAPGQDLAQYNDTFGVLLNSFEII